VKWIIAGCLGLGFVSVVVVACLVAAFVFGILRNSDATKLALERAQSNAAVVQRLGQPLEPGWIISGNIKTTGSYAHAELEIPVHGNRGKGTIYVVASRLWGTWTFSTLEVAFADGTPRVDLLGPHPPPEPAQ
jgi:hypothetical protein